MPFGRPLVSARTLTTPMEDLAFEGRIPRRRLATAVDRFGLQPFEMEPVESDFSDLTDLLPPGAGLQVPTPEGVPQPGTPGGAQPQGTAPSPGAAQGGPSDLQEALGYAKQGVSVLKEGVKLGKGLTDLLAPSHARPETTEPAWQDYRTGEITYGNWGGPSSFDLDALHGGAGLPDVSGFDLGGFDQDFLYGGAGADAAASGAATAAEGTVGTVGQALGYVGQALPYIGFGLNTAQTLLSDAPTDVKAVNTGINAAAMALLATPLAPLAMAAPMVQSLYMGLRDLWGGDYADVRRSEAATLSGDALPPLFEDLRGAQTPEDVAKVLKDWKAGPFYLSTKDDLHDIANFTAEIKGGHLALPPQMHEAVTNYVKSQLVVQQMAAAGNPEAQRILAEGARRAQGSQLGRTIREQTLVRPGMPVDLPDLSGAGAVDAPYRQGALDRMRAYLFPTFGVGALHGSDLAEAEQSLAEFDALLPQAGGALDERALEQALMDWIAARDRRFLDRTPVPTP